MNNVHHGEFIICQTEVIFFKKRKKKKKQASPQCANLLLTSNNVSLVDSKTNRDRLMFPRNVLIDFRFNKNTDPDFKQYKLELSVWIKEKRHEICIEFPTDDAEQQRDKFIEHFTKDKAKPIENYPLESDGPNNQKQKPQISASVSASQTPQTSVPPPSPSSLSYF